MNASFVARAGGGYSILGGLTGSADEMADRSRLCSKAARQRIALSKILLYTSFYAPSLGVPIIVILPCVRILNTPCTCCH
jgi:hypothetical protein